MRWCGFRAVRPAPVSETCSLTVLAVENEISQESEVLLQRVGKKYEGQEYSVNFNQIDPFTALTITRMPFRSELFFARSNLWWLKAKRDRTDKSLRFKVLVPVWSTKHVLIALIEAPHNEIWIKKKLFGANRGRWVKLCPVPHRKL